jgi:hypothetical protein
MELLQEEGAAVVVALASRAVLVKEVVEPGVEEMQILRAAKILAAVEVDKLRATLLAAVPVALVLSSFVMLILIPMLHLPQEAQHSPILVDTRFTNGHLLAQLPSKDKQWIPCKTQQLSLSLKLYGSPSSLLYAGCWSNPKVR